MNIDTLQKMPRFTKFAVNLAMKPIRNTIKKKAKFDLKYDFLVYFIYYV